MCFFFSFGCCIAMKNSATWRVFKKKKMFHNVLGSLITAGVQKFFIGRWGGWIGTGALCAALLLLLLFIELFDGLDLLFEFHAPVLEPDLDLTFRQTEGVRDLDPPPPRQVAVEVELFLQFQRLEPRVRLTGAFRVGPHFCKLLKWLQFKRVLKDST